MKTERQNTARSTAAFFLGLILCARASATIINTNPDWDGSVTLGYPKVAQSFLAPLDSVLLRWQFALTPVGAPTNVLFQIVPWDLGPRGAPLFAREVDWPASGGDILVDNINLTLTPGSRYAAIMDLKGYLGLSVRFQYNQNSYTQGNAAWFDGPHSEWTHVNSVWNTEFRAEFIAIPEPANLLGLGLVIAALRRYAEKVTA